VTRSARCDPRGAGRRPAPFPAVTLGLCALALLTAQLPGAGAALVFERGALAAGECWRLLTGHWVHWSTDHLLWDVGTFAALGAACELRSRRRFAVCVVGSALAISAAVFYLLPELERYGGLSGIDCALFALLGTELWRERRREGGRKAAALAAALGTALALKLGFEFFSGGNVFVANLGASIVPVPAAHVAGAAVGLAVPLAGALAPLRQEG
jgi:rhomboid family GlyGly-CTERM serine protease